MPMEKEKAVLFWSGGKDSAMCLWELCRSGRYEVVALITAIYESEQCVTMHRVPRELIEAQAHALGLPLYFIDVPKSCTNVVYLERINAKLSSLRDEQGVTKAAFGDLFLDDIRDFREEHLEKIGMEGLFPLWHRDTRELSQQFINAKFRAIVTCVDEHSLSAEFVGRAYDRNFVADLPLGVDPCGENGEFHTFVFDGPCFKRPLAVKSVDTANDRGFHYCQLTQRKTAPRAAAGKQTCKAVKSS